MYIQMVCGYYIKDMHDLLVFYCHAHVLRKNKLTYPSLNFFLKKELFNSFCSSC